MAIMFRESDSESSNSSNSSSLEIHKNDTSNVSPKKRSAGSSPIVDNLDPSLLMAKCIIHLDIDCFYCQCEEIQKPYLSQKPLAIGQKHIIVTANYVARRLGVKKLMGRIDALRVCPSLTIVEGSDLEKYRKASREVYDEFRNAVKGYGSENIAKKGSMDEMFADITFAVKKYCEENSRHSEFDITSNNCNEKTFIYGAKGGSTIVRIAEDQSGVEAIIDMRNNNNYPKMYFNDWGSHEDRQICERNLKITLLIASQIRERIRSKTQYSTTIGVSVSPLLAKLASDLKKPDSTNLLYPWLAKTIIHEMPLRRIPLLGSKTYKVLSQCLETFNKIKRDDKFWTCRDLLNVPRHLIVSSLAEVDSFHHKCEEQCDLLLNRCNGIDTSPIIDDDGGLTKTVSVEDSFMRGSVTSLDSVQEKLVLLYKRLLRLLDQRRDLSPNPSLSYPKSIRLSIRLVDQNLNGIGRRPFRTISKQCNINGKLLLEKHHTDDDECKKEQIIHNSASSLLNQLLLKWNHSNTNINVTRLNLAAISFADINNISPDSGSICSSTWLTQRNKKTSDKSLTNYFSSKNNNSRPSNSNLNDVSMSTSSQDDKLEKIIQLQENIQHNEIYVPSSRKKRVKTNHEKDPVSQQQRSLKTPSWIDPTVFGALPADIANEVMNHEKLYHQSTISNGFSKQKEKKGIQSYFIKKKS